MIEPRTGWPLANWIVTQRRWLLYLGLALAVVGAYLGTQLHLDHSVEDLFAESDPILQPYRQLQKTFGRNDILLAVYSEPELTSADGQQSIFDLTESIHNVPGVVGAVSLMDLPSAADFDDSGRGEKFRKVFTGYTHNQEHNIAGVICLLDVSSGGLRARRTTMSEVRKIVAALPSGTLVGETVILQEAFDLLEADGARLNTWCTVLLLGVVWICFRSWRWLLLTFVVVQMTLALTRGLLVVLGLQLTMVSSMLAAIVTVVSVAMVIHVIVRFRAGLEAGLTRQVSFAQTMQILAWPILFACLTDAAGFAALMISEVGPIQDFGLMMALGSTMVIVSALLAVPGIVLLGSGTSVPQQTTNSRGLQHRLIRLLNWATTHRTRILLTGATLSVVAAFGCPLLKVETDFTKNFHRESDLLQGYAYVEDHFGGAGVWDILIPIQQPPDKQFLLNLLTLERELEQDVTNVTSAISVADAIDAGTNGLEKVDLLAKTAVRSAISVMRARMPTFVEAIYHPPGPNSAGLVRIMLRSPERLPAEAKLAVIEEVEQLTHESFPAAEVTGYYVLLTSLVDSLLGDQWTTFAVAAIAILVMMTIAFGSFRLAVVTLIPNALPVLWVFGTMGLLEIRMNMGAAMIAAVSLGLSVDGSIHYVTSFLRERQTGASVTVALERVHRTVGLAAVLATLALVVGFATLCISEFLPTVYFGTLVSLSMLGGLVGNLVVLPLLIQAVERDANENVLPGETYPQPHLNGQTHENSAVNRV